MPKSTKQKLEYQKAYNARPTEVAKRVKNNAARRSAIKTGAAKVGDGKDVAHVVSLKNGGTNKAENLSVQKRATNRGWRRGSSSYNPDK
jgi:hypothetical protein